ncbi:MAG: type IV pilus twitching motility protein PilT [Elusimicrobiota bacterium]|jgi:twitching motility protein PilT
MEIVDVLKATVQKGGSDLHWVIGQPPMIRLDGELRPMTEFPVLTAEESKRLIYGFLSDEHRTRFEQDWELDFSVAVEGISRFRTNVLLQKNGIEAVMRVIPVHIPTPEELQLPPVVTDLANLPRGLVLVTGPTGSGKSTTLACLINLINQKQRKHILTIEDPIEFVYVNTNSVVRQREIGQQCHSFGEALRHALRQDPDVVMIGEMRDLETISAALTMAETGHLVFATLHTTDAAQTVDRIIDVFPAHQQQQVRAQLSSVLKGVVCQTLLPRVEGKGRVAAREVMIVTPAIANNIREGKTHQIYGAIDTGSRVGMVSLDRALADLVKKGLISIEDALSKANRPELIRPTGSSAGA